MSIVAGAANGQIIEHSFYFESSSTTGGSAPGPQSLWNRDGTVGITFGASTLTFTGAIAFGGVIALANGSAAAPSLNFTNSATTGLYRNASNVIGVAIAGVPALAIGASAPTVSAAAGVAGSDVYLRAASAGAGTAFAGGLINITSGVGSAATAANTGGAGGALAHVAGAGGTTVTGTGGIGGAASLTAGAGGAPSGAGTSGAGGAVNLVAGAAGVGSATTGAAGGAVNITAGAGAVAVAGGALVFAGGQGGATGAGGAVSITSGAGGATSGLSGTVTIASGVTTAESTSASGAVTVQSGAGSNSTGATNGGASGAVTVRSQAGGTSVTGTGGAAGTLSLTGGAGGVASGAATGGAGASVAITAGNGGNGGTASGAAGSVTITAGSAGTGGNVNGGNVSLTPGTATGTGTPGAVIAVGFRASSISAAAITTTRTLTVQDSGGIFSVAKSSAYAITLPTPTQGLRYKFMVLDAGANAVTISDGAAHLFGIASIANVNTALTGTTLTLAATGSVGDWVEFEGIDSTHYLVTGACIAAGDITIA